MATASVKIRNLTQYPIEIEDIGVRIRKGSITTVTSVDVLTIVQSPKVQQLLASNSIRILVNGVSCTTTEQALGEITESNMGSITIPLSSANVWTDTNTFGAAVGCNTTLTVTGATKLWTTLGVGGTITASGLSTFQSTAVFNKPTTATSTALFSGPIYTSGTIVSVTSSATFAQPTTVTSTALFSGPIYTSGTVVSVTSSATFAQPATFTSSAIFTQPIYAKATTAASAGVTQVVSAINFTMTIENGIIVKVT